MTKAESYGPTRKLNQYQWLDLQDMQIFKIDPVEEEVEKPRLLKSFESLKTLAQILGREMIEF